MPPTAAGGGIWVIGGDGNTLGACRQILPTQLGRVVVAAAAKAVEAELFVHQLAFVNVRALQGHGKGWHGRQAEQWQQGTLFEQFHRVTPRVVTGSL